VGSFSSFWVFFFAPAAVNAVTALIFYLKRSAEFCFVGFWCIFADPFTPF
jgi:hypothetical protein